MPTASVAMDLSGFRFICCRANSLRVRVILVENGIMKNTRCSEHGFASRDAKEDPQKDPQQDPPERSLKESQKEPQKDSRKDPQKEEDARYDSFSRRRS